MDDRWLTNKDLIELMDKTYGGTGTYTPTKYDQAIVQAQDAKTLKEVGEWLDKQIEVYSSVDYFVTILRNALKQGEMPG